MQELHTTDSEFSSLPTPSASQEPGFTAHPVDKNGNPTNNPNERWYHPETGRLMQKGITQVLRENELLRTPKASEGQGGALGEAEALRRGNTVGVRDQVMDLVASQGQKVSRTEVNLMPTPNTMDHLPARTPEQKALNKGKGGYANVRETVVNELLGTPRTSSANGSTAKQVESDAPKARIEDQVLVQDWGKFEPAIRRWEETLGRPAPAPTKPDGKEGAHRLSSAFTEWMMGLPEGWITDVGLSRNEELKACGNGVVPQQAELALRILLEGVDLN